MLLEQEVDIHYVKNRVMETAGFNPDDSTIESAVHNLNLNFVTERLNGKNLRVSEVSGFRVLNYNSKSQKISRGPTLEEHIMQPSTVEYLADLAQASIATFLNDFDLQNYSKGFSRGKILPKGRF